MIEFNCKRRLSVDSQTLYNGEFQGDLPFLASGKVFGFTEASIFRVSSSSAKDKKVKQKMKKKKIASFLKATPPSVFYAVHVALSFYSN